MTMAQQFNDIKYYIPINPFAILKAAEFIKENSLICSEGRIGLWGWRTIIFRDGSIIGLSHLIGSPLTTIFG